jgi:ATPase subunit of ABC transporter with duplicated ATPase domains
METKICPSCNIDKPRSEYYKKLESISYRCKKCTLDENKKRANKYIGKYSDYQNAWKRKQTDQNTEYNKRRKELKRERYQAQKDKINEARRKRYSTDEDYRAACLSRCSDRRQNVPKWVNFKEIADFYKKCPLGHEVDHIIPLNGVIDGRRVCGLHVLWNLQYLTIEENRRKYNIVKEQSSS